MRIKASCGNAPKTESLDTCVYSLTLTAETQGEKRWLAALLKSINSIDLEWDAMLRAVPPFVRVVTQFRK